MRRIFLVALSSAILHPAIGAAQILRPLQQDRSTRVEAQVWAFGSAPIGVDSSEVATDFGSWSSDLRAAQYWHPYLIGSTANASQTSTIGGDSIHVESRTELNTTIYDGDGGASTAQSDFSVRFTTWEPSAFLLTSHLSLYGAFANGTGEIRARLALAGAGGELTSLEAFCSPGSELECRDVRDLVESGRLPPGEYTLDFYAGGSVRCSSNSQGIGSIQLAVELRLRPLVATKATTWAAMKRMYR